MSLTLHLHPLSSYCWKALIAFYENGTAFETAVVNFGDPASAAAFRELWPVAKMPVLRDEAREQTIPEASIVIEYLMLHYPGAARLIPTDPDAALQVRLADRFFDLHVHEHVQRIVGDRLRPADSKDPLGVDDARRRLRLSLDLLESRMAARTWAEGEDFTLADCAAAPALFYAEKVEPFGDSHPNVVAYLDRLLARPSVSRVAEEAQPYFHMFPQ